MFIIRNFIKAALFAVTALSLTAGLALADSYSWKNLQSDIPGVAAHTDPNLVNPWGMAANSSGSTIWVSDNGTGVSTLYHQDGAAQPLIVTRFVANSPRSASAERTLIHPFGDSCVATLRAISLNQLAAERIALYAQKPRARDVFDLWFILTQGANELDPEKTRELVQLLAHEKRIVADGHERRGRHFSDG